MKNSTVTGSWYGSIKPEPSLGGEILKRPSCSPSLCIFSVHVRRFTAKSLSSNANSRPLNISEDQYICKKTSTRHVSSNFSPSIIREALKISNCMHKEISDNHFMFWQLYCGKNEALPSFVFNSTTLQSSASTSRENSPLYRATDSCFCTHAIVS